MYIINNIIQILFLVRKGNTTLFRSYQSGPLWHKFFGLGLGWIWMNPGPYPEPIVGLKTFLGQSAPWWAICGPPLMEQVWLRIRASRAEVSSHGRGLFVVVFK